MISRDKYFRYTLSEGRLSSFKYLGDYLNYLSRTLLPDYPSFGEDRVVEMIRKHGKDIIVSQEDIIAVHDLHKEKIEYLKAEEHLNNIPVGARLTNGMVCIFDGHHRIASRIERRDPIVIRVIDIPKVPSGILMDKISWEERQSR